MTVNNEQKFVSNSYQKAMAVDSVNPAKALDDKILQAAEQGIKRKEFVLRKRWVYLSAVAASLFVAVMSLPLLTTSPETQSIEQLVDKPMYLLQRTKVPSASEFSAEIERLIQQGELVPAQRLYKRFRVYYPEANISAEAQTILFQHQ